jgi:hypothetical protein
MIRKKNFADYSVLLGFARFCSVLPLISAFSFQLSSQGCKQEPKKLAEGLIRLN